MTNFVLVHGGWHGGWCWRIVADRLRANGHRVATPTLTGLAERSHLLSAEVDLQTHIQDVVNTVKWDELGRFVLCGHSYGGVVITGVAEQLESQIDGIVYLDAILPRDGQSCVQAGRHDPPEPLKGLVMPPWPAAGFFKAPDPQICAWMDALLTPHPLKSFTQPLRVSGAYDRIPSKSFVLSEAWAVPAVIETHTELSRDPSWRTYTSPYGHDLMIEDPELVIKVLVDTAAGAEVRSPSQNSKGR